MPVQLNGRVAEMNSILRIAKKYNLIIIEDSCQALGAKFDNRFAGTFGVAGTFSFFPAKTLGCFGDGGAIITDQNDIHEEARIIRDHGRDPPDGKIKMFGFNSRLDNIQAAILNLKLKYYAKDIQRRRDIATIYQEYLYRLDALKLPPSPEEDPMHFDIYQNYEIEAEDRDKLREFLKKRGIDTIIQWGGYMLHQFEKLGFSNDLPYTENISKKFMLLPIHPMLSDEDVSYICKNIIDFYEV